MQDTLYTLSHLPITVWLNSGNRSPAWTSTKNMALQGFLKYFQFIIYIEKCYSTEKEGLTNLCIKLRKVNWNNYCIITVCIEWFNFICILYQEVWILQEKPTRGKLTGSKPKRKQLLFLIPAYTDICLRSQQYFWSKNDKVASHLGLCTSS